MNLRLTGNEKVLFCPFEKKAVIRGEDDKLRTLTTLELIELLNLAQGRAAVVPLTKKISSQAAVEASPEEHELGSYEVGFGKYRGQKLRAIPRLDLIDYCNYLANEGRGLHALAAELLVKAKDYLAFLERMRSSN